MTKCGAIVSIHAGTGGVDAYGLGVYVIKTLHQMERKKGYKVTITDYQNDTEAGIKSATIMVDGENAYGYLKKRKRCSQAGKNFSFNTAGKDKTSRRKNPAD